MSSKSVGDILWGYLDSVVKIYPHIPKQSTTGKLSATAVKQAKPGDKPRKLSDGGGLYLLVKPNGSKYWRLKYRLHGKEKTFSLGVYPTVSLAEVREDALEAKRLISKGVDPTTHRKQERARKKDIRFRIIAKKWHTKESGRWTADHAERVWQTLKADAFPLIGDIPVDQITAQDALGVIRKIEERGALDVAARVKQRMSAVFRYAIYTGKTTSLWNLDQKISLSQFTTQPHQLLRVVQAAKGSNTRLARQAGLVKARKLSQVHPEWRNDMPRINCMTLFMDSKLRLRQDLIDGSSLPRQQKKESTNQKGPLVTQKRSPSG